MSETCKICPHACKLQEGTLGVCGARTVEQDHIVCLNYGEATALALDPIEKKPLALFHPGTMILSYGSFGCNLKCPFCQNHDIATARVDRPIATRFISPEQLVEEALLQKTSGNIGIAFTYNEPYIAYEYLQDVARKAHEQDLACVAVTNGYVSVPVWEESLSLIDAFNIDLKCYSENGYRELGAPQGLSVVKGSIESAYYAGCHVEVTTLVVPGFSDDEHVFTEQCLWLASVGTDIPLHISRFFPCHKASHKRPTDKRVMERFKQIAEHHLEHVFLGNV